MKGFFTFLFISLFATAAHASIVIGNSVEPFDDRSFILDQFSNFKILFEQTLTRVVDLPNASDDTRRYYQNERLMLLEKIRTTKLLMTATGTKCELRIKENDYVFSAKGCYLKFSYSRGMINVFEDSWARSFLLKTFLYQVSSNPWINEELADQLLAPTSTANSNL